MNTSFKDSFKGERNTSTFNIIGKDISGTCVTVHNRGITLPAGNKPRGSVFSLRQNSRAFIGRGGKLLKTQIVLYSYIKARICNFSFTGQHSVYLNPFGPS